MKSKKIGVCGAGIMGNGIAQVCVVSGFSVVMYDISEKMLEKGMAVIKKNLYREVEKGKREASDAESILARIIPTSDIGALMDRDAVIEAVCENVEIKKSLFKKLDETCKPETYFITNTSSLSVTEIASVTKRPEKVVGIHFFNPVPVMKLVEVIKGCCTSAEVFSEAMTMAADIGKEPIAVEEAPLFAVNRILVPMINEAFFVLQEGIASAEDIDKGLMMGANHPIGPLALADLIGLDTLYEVINTLYTETGDSKYRPATLMKKLVRAGKYGRKTGEGVYQY